MSRELSNGKKLSDLTKEEFESLPKKERNILLGFREDYDENNRIIGRDFVTFKNKNYLVSTVDLGIDHSFGYEEPKEGIFWETMIFKAEELGDLNTINYYDLYCRRYTSKEEAKENHCRIVQAFNNNPELIKFEYACFDFEWDRFLNKR